MMTVRLDFDDLVDETDLACCLAFSDEHEVWVPKSIILELDEEDGEVEVPQWFAYKEGLI